jgi:hypothetical protein
MTSSDEFHTQNKFIQDLVDKSSTDNTKSVYLTEQIGSLVYMNGWLFWIFVVLAILFSAFLLLNPKIKNWSLKVKIAIISLVLFYPFYIYHVEKYAVISYVYIKDMIMGNPYVAPDF